MIGSSATQITREHVMTLFHHDTSISARLKFVASLDLFLLENGHDRTYTVDEIGLDLGRGSGKNEA